MESTETAKQNPISECGDSKKTDAHSPDTTAEQHDSTELLERLSLPSEPQIELNRTDVSGTNLNSDSNPTLLDAILEDSQNLVGFQTNNVDSVASSLYPSSSRTEVVSEDCPDATRNEVDAAVPLACSESSNTGLEAVEKMDVDRIEDSSLAETGSTLMEVEHIDSNKDGAPTVSSTHSDTSELEKSPDIVANETETTSESSIIADNDQPDNSGSMEANEEATADIEEILSSAEKNEDEASKLNKVDPASDKAKTANKDETSISDTALTLDKDESSTSDTAPTSDKERTPTVNKDKVPTLDKDGVSTGKEDKTIFMSEQESETVPESGKEPVSMQNSVQGCNSIDQENSEDGESENPVFVHVITENENEKEDSDKNTTESNRQEIQDEEDFQNSQPQEDPIASDDFVPLPMEEETEDAEQGPDEEQGASEELCIIPDTERVISQEEKDAAASMVPLRDPSDSDGIFSTSTTDDASKELSTEEPKESGKYVISTCTDENVNACMQCCLPRKSKYSILNNKKTSYLCDDNCLNSFRERFGEKVVLNTEGDLRVKKLTSGVNNDNMVAKVKFHRKCMECEKKILNDEVNLSWETMEFCNEFCLSKYQKRIGSNCANCQAEVRSNCLGKYCVRFGYDIRQFCSSVCLEEYKKGLKVCSYCQKDMSGGGDGFLAPVGDKGQFKDFCTQQCMEKYDIMSNNREQPVSKSGNTCSVCLNEKPITIEFEHDNKMNLFCGEPCFVAFKFVNNITPGKCDMCRKYFDNKILEEHSMYYDNAQHSFCSKSCQNIYIIAHRKIVPCSWCKVKKYNFDMIKRNFCPGPVLMMCSLNCLSLYQVSVNAVNSKKIKCDHCHKSLQPLYHLTMSDATIRNFCSYPCVMAFQNQFPKAPITLNEPEEANVPVPTGGPKRSKRTSSKNAESVAVPADVPTIPVISSVQSLATTNGPTSANTRATRGKNNIDSAINMNSTATTVVKTQIKQQYIIKSAPIPPQRNVGTMCKVIQATKGVSCKPQLVNKEVQTDDMQDKTAVIPIPVPIFVPSPMWMYSMPFPVPFPFPLPVPVPMFIPTTRNSANGIMKEIKKIQVKIPTDPFEAELLMMAEMVAGDKKEENTDSESEEEDTAVSGDFSGAADEGSFSPEPVDASNTFGDDMLQMALKMATELDEPAVDLEGALTASTITASQGNEPAVAGTEESVDDPQPIHHMMERQAIRGRKRPGRPPRSAASKRGRRSSSQMEMPMMAPPQPPAPPEPVEKPDANMCLKYTFGVNAWKQWVTTKNAELEKSSRRVKLFKPEILQLTADELNYSLCLFVKEVRKPNGQEYAPDTIYYLCLGIQQYLFENGRIDNIFCDSYYEKFTDCLDEVAKKFSILYNDSHYIVTRVEEEHLWESKQLGAHSPHVLLSTLMFFNTKHFNLTTVDEHMQLSFSHIMKHWKRNPNQPGTNKVAGSRNVLLRFYPPQTNTESSQRKKKVYEQQENEENPLRCPVKLYEFYLSKCPESVKTRNDVFYLLPERSCVPDSPVWYSTMPLPRNALEKMLHRVKMVKEINVALLTS